MLWFGRETPVFIRFLINQYEDACEKVVVSPKVLQCYTFHESFLDVGVTDVVPADGPVATMRCCGFDSFIGLFNEALG